MTSQEARKEIDDCESQIEGTYNSLRHAARNMGSSVTEAIKQSTLIRTLWPLVISLVGLILTASHPFWGWVLIIGGILAAGASHSEAAMIQRDVENLVKQLNDTIDQNMDI